MDKNKDLSTEATMARSSARLPAALEGKPRAQVKLLPLYMLIVLCWAFVGSIIYALVAIVRGSS